MDWGTADRGMLVDTQMQTEDGCGDRGRDGRLCDTSQTMPRTVASPGQLDMTRQTLPRVFNMIVVLSQTFTSEFWPSKL